MMADGLGEPAGDLAFALAKAASFGFKLEALISGMGDLLHVFALCLAPRERAELLQLLDLLIDSLDSEEEADRAIAPKALRAMLRQQHHLRVLDGGRRAPATNDPRR